MIIGLIYLLIGIASLVISIYLDVVLKRKYYKLKVREGPTNRISFFIALITPKEYFKKESIQAGYTLLIFSIILKVITGYFLFMLLHLSLK
jgi:hypothetical protein